MKYWLLAATSLTSGLLLLNGALKPVLPWPSRLALFLAVILVGAGRRMVQERLHRRHRGTPRPGA